MPEREYILFSGGLDSFLLANEHPEAQGVYYDLGGRYSEYEKANIERINTAITAGQVAVEHEITIAPLNFYPENFEEDSGYIPYRNLVLLLKASMEPGCSTIYFGVVNEWQRDKSRKFVNLAEFIMRDMGKRDITVETPYRGVSKSKLIKQYLERGGSKENLMLTRSCVADTEKECGACVSCNSKHIAFVNNGIDIADHFETEPSIDNYIHERLEKTFTKDFRFARLPSTTGRLYEAIRAKRAEARLRR